MFSCNLPPAHSPEWPGSFTCHCDNTEVESGTRTESCLLYRGNIPCNTHLSLPAAEPSFSSTCSHKCMGQSRFYLVLSQKGLDAQSCFFPTELKYLELKWHRTALSLSGTGSNPRSPSYEALAGETSDRQPLGHFALPLSCTVCGSSTDRKKAGGVCIFNIQSVTKVVFIMQGPKTVHDHITSGGVLFRSYHTSCYVSLMLPTFR